MLDNLTQRLGRVVKTLRGEARLTEANIDGALREVRMALLEADVALPVVKDFIAAVRAKAVGQEVVGSLTPGQALIGVVQREARGAHGRRRCAAQPCDHATGGDPARGPAGRREDDQRRQARSHPSRPAEKKGAPGELRRLPAGGDRAAADARRAGRRRVLPLPRRSAAARHRGSRARLGAQALHGCRHRRHRRAPRHRRRDDARDRAAARVDETHRDAVRGRRDARSGRGQHREGVCSGAAAHRHRAYQARRRRAVARRCRCAASPVRRSSSPESARSFPGWKSSTPIAWRRGFSAWAMF